MILEEIMKRKDIPTDVREEIQKSVSARILSGKGLKDSERRGIAECRKVDQRLLDSEEKFRSYVENAPDGIFVANSQGEYIDVNPAACNLLGYTKKELLGLSIMDVTAPGSRDAALSEFGKLAKEKKVNGEYLFRHADGHEFYMSVDAVKLSGDKFLGFCKDITKRKHSEEMLERSHKDLEKSLYSTVDALASTVEAKDLYNGRHQRRVAHLAAAIASEMEYSSDRVRLVRTAAIVHDLGKIHIPSEILSKPGKLSDIEYALIKTHVQASYDILKNIDFPWPIADIVYQHHERIDGSGYPRGLKGSQTLAEAKIISVADVVEAMSSHRPYRAALGVDKALDELQMNRGILYDAKVVDSCIKLFKEKDFHFDLELPVK